MARKNTIYAQVFNLRPGPKTLVYNNEFNKITVWKHNLDQRNLGKSCAFD